MKRDCYREAKDSRGNNSEQQGKTKCTVVAALQGSASSTKRNAAGNFPLGLFGCLFSLRFVKQQRPFLRNGNHFSSISNSKTRKVPWGIHSRIHSKYSVVLSKHTPSMLKCMMRVWWMHCNPLTFQAARVQQRPGKKIKRPCSRNRLKLHTDI